MGLAVTLLEMPTMSIVKKSRTTQGDQLERARPWIAMLGAAILFLGWEPRNKRREIQKLDLEIAQMRSQQSLVRVATIHEMNSLIKDVEEISARKLGILGAFRQKAGAHFRAGREAVRMFLRVPFPFVFFLAIGAGAPEQKRVRSDIYWRFISGFCPSGANPGSVRAECALYANRAKAA